MLDNIELCQELALQKLPLVLLFLLCGLLAICSYDQRTISAVSATDKAKFLRLMTTLPTAGEFFADPAYPIANPYLHVLLSLDKNDIGMDIYPFVALSRLLHDASKQNRVFAARHFNEIRHEWLKMFWAVLLFEYSNECTEEIVLYLKSSLNDNRSQIIQSIAGPEFEKLKVRILMTTMPK